jgi:hypothetical protein
VIADEAAISKPRTIHHLSVRERRRMLVTSVLSILVKGALLITAYYLAPFESAGRDDVGLRIAIALAIIAAAVVLAARSIMRAEFPLMRAIDGVGTLVLLMLLVFASTYVLMSVSNAAAFNEPLEHTSALYFALTTSTTIGYGDIAAKTDSARIVVMIHMVVNVLLIGIAARVLFQTARRRAEAM